MSVQTETLASWHPGWTVVSIKNDWATVFADVPGYDAR